jgi:hypothetical protein
VAAGADGAVNSWMERPKIVQIEAALLVDLRRRGALGPHESLREHYTSCAMLEDEPVSAEDVSVSRGVSVSMQWRSLLCRHWWLRVFSCVFAFAPR